MIRQINFQLKSYITIFKFKVCSPPLEPANPLYCILVWPIYTIYVSGKLVQGGGTYFKIENGDQPISLSLIENKFDLIHVSMIRM